MKKVLLSGIPLTLMLLGLVVVDDACAVPSFARQTGLDCTACHTAFPELTRFGREFKLRGYTMGGGDTKMPLPLAALVLTEMTSIANNRNPDGSNAVVNDNGVNKNNVPMLSQVSLFYAGKIYGNVGAFIQLTYDGTLLPQDRAVATQTAMDNVDIRYADSTMFGDKELLYGLSVNNSPSVQDPWSTMSAWGFPYASSAVAPTPEASVLIDGGLGQVAEGATAYAVWDDTLYAEGGLYQTIPNGGILGVLGWHNGGTDPVIDGAAPYGRIALEHDFGNQYVMIGGYGMTTRLKQEGTDKRDTYRDWAVDAEYQFDSGCNDITVSASEIWETANLDASQTIGAADNATDRLTTSKVKAGYYYDHTYGLTLGYVATSGTADAARYGTSGTLRPDSSYETAELDYLPIQQVKLSLQYTMYNKFNGAASNYDGSGRNASDNDTLYVAGWFMF